MLLIATAVAKYAHDCYMGSPPQCYHPLVEDPLCVGTMSSSLDAWQSLTCDYTIINAPNAASPKRWVVVHAGGCDTGTARLGPWLAADRSASYFALRTCAGFNPNTCGANRTTCQAIHISWTFPTQDARLGLGLNIPALVDIYHTPGSRLLWLHEYDDGYSWTPAVCNAADKPIFVCVDGDDPEFGAKLPKIRSALEALSQSEFLPCRVVVVDARNSSAVPGSPADSNPALPCSGLYPSEGTSNIALEFDWRITAALTLALLHYPSCPPSGAACGGLRALANAADIVLAGGADTPVPVPEGSPLGGGKASKKGLLGLLGLLALVPAAVCVAAIAAAACLARRRRLKAATACASGVAAPGWWGMQTAAAHWPGVL